MRSYRAIGTLRLVVAVTIAAAIAMSGCTGVSGGGSKSGSGTSNTPASPAISVSVSPNGANVRVGAQQQFSAAVTGSSNTGVTWQVNGVTGGSPSTGTISAAGAYAAPATLPAQTSVTVGAVSAASASSTGTATVTLLNPVATLSGISPATVPSGNFSLTITGANFISGAQLLLNGSPLATTFSSSTALLASGTISSAGNFTVTVVNPNSGGTASNGINLSVTSTSGSQPPSQPSACSGMTPGQGGSLNGFLPFPSTNPWNQDVSAAPVDANSAAMIAFIGNSIGIHADFGSGFYAGNSIGIPYMVVGGSQGGVGIDFTAYGDESDPGPMPVPLTAPIEGYPNPGNGDRHVLVLDNRNCFLYELYSAYPGASTWSAASTAVWDLTANGQRPYSWTSADAAGLPIFPGLVRYDEVAAGQINHALRFTLQSTRAAFVPPASHWAANSSNANAAPMGMKLRLKANFDVSHFSAANQAILKAMKKYGMIVADNGSSMYLSGAPDDRWDNNDLHALGGATAANFEVVQMNPVYTAANVPHGAAPVISSFTASSQLVSPGAAVTLSWNVANASYLIVSPEIGALRGSSVVVNPQQSTTYTIYATNAFGRTSATINVGVH